MTEKNNGLQDLFLNSLRKSKTPVTMFLVKGVKLQGVVTWFDNFSVLLRRDGQSQLVYKHSISTIMPSQSPDRTMFDAMMSNVQHRPGMLQDVFLYAMLDKKEPVTTFLVNGVMLQGSIAAYDLFSLLLERDGTMQLVYKHAVSTIQPLRTVNLAEYNKDADGGDD
ncbi:RNA chaperone Hfq [uncultured Sphingorhabdus sp.]|jgi:host factor-I protein|uniref:RNA chaperone Hfq n=1 Tax=uncultured Sphingorhabdus sp. TaxID=1686106 RepID=UPI0026017FFA|nr:RNA chaperone Hfq [uncultured Sphingorhabdus sp.]HMS20685.1 RNA chaperone Hfq [Sphingorhabdus sp.]